MEKKALIVALGLLFATAAVVEAANNKKCEPRQAQTSTERVADEATACDGDWGC